MLERQKNKIFPFDFLHHFSPILSSYLKTKKQNQLLQFFSLKI
jgi:hypothetical protein